MSVDVVWFVEMKTPEGWEIASDYLESKGDAEQAASDWRRDYGEDTRVTAFIRMGVER